jgi:hypothetical protein
MKGSVKKYDEYGGKNPCTQELRFGMSSQFHASTPLPLGEVWLILLNFSSRWTLCDAESKIIQVVTDGKATEEATEFEYLGNSILEFKKDVDHELQSYSRMNYTIKRNFGK